MKQAIIEFSYQAYEFLILISWIGLAIIVFILLPLAIFRRTRGFASLGIFIISYVFGATVWFLGVAVTLSTWGWVGLIIGLAFAGIGVVPIAILAAFISLGNVSIGFSLITILFIVIISRIGATYLAELSDK